MTREERTTRLVHARQVAAATKRRHTLKVLAEQAAAGERVTFAGVARAASVSGWFVRNHPDIRQGIERAMTQQHQKGMPDKRTIHTSDQGLRADLLLAREEIRELRAERDHLKGRLRQHLGGELDHGSRSELLARLNALATEHQQLTGQHEALTLALTEAQGARDDALIALEAARVANRRLIRELGKPQSPG
ncbi:DUF6262 family protein [Janibacter melonis]|uniref:DUF6262 family protein n=1 Tax=Janibacter melonis TaxID=262209 RepID=UPI0025B50B58|nr:DUF6262 family protein [Janibacter melonis]